MKKQKIDFTPMTEADTNNVLADVAEIRAIEFRAWSRESFDDDDNGVFEMINPDRLSICEFNLLKDQLRSNDNFKLMQYTGLLDIKGRKIFEGDILSDSVEVDGEMVESKCQVFFRDGSFMLDLSNEQNKTFAEYLYRELQLFDYEVVGHIYERKVCDSNVC